MKCPVCQAPNGVCTGDDIEKVKESGMESKRKPMKMPKQHVRNGTAGYVGEDNGLVETFERGPRFAENGQEPTLSERLAGMTDKQLETLGVQRPSVDEGEKEESKTGELHTFQPNRGGVNCLDCRKNESNGNHTASVVETDDATDETPDSQKLVGKRKATTKKKTPTKRHTPRAKVAAKG